MEYPPVIVEHTHGAFKSATISVLVVGLVFVWGCEWSTGRRTPTSPPSTPAPARRPPAKPKPVPAERDPFVEITAGNQHSCARRQSGAVLCWGRNNYGQLGNDTRDDSTEMVSVRGLSDAVEIEAGGDFSCARRRSGRVVCWGNNQFGQLGDGRGAKVGVWSTRPTAVVGLSDATDLGVGESFACALRRSGAVVCWGEGSDGQLGSSAARFFAKPRPISGIGGVTSMAVGGSHVCVAVRGGQVKCWGRNSEGQLGDGERASRTNARAVLQISDARSLISGARHTCALRAGDKLSCWGDDRQGQLGLGGAATRYRTPQAVRGLTRMKKIVAGDQHTCALFSASDLRCWGGNEEGQIERTKRPRRTPFKVGGIRGVVDVAAGHRHTCVLSRGEVYCWGLSDSGALGPNPLR